MKTFDKVVLLSLQYSEIPNFLIEAIKKGTSIFWLIRLHPRYINERKMVENRLSKISNRNYELNVANDSTIYDLFHIIDVQITFWSTVAYEALAYNVPTIIAHQNGKDAMINYIDKGIFRYSEDSNEIIDLIMNNKVHFSKEEYKYIDSNGELIVNSLLNLVSDYS